MCHYMVRYARLFDPGAKSGQQGRDGDRVGKIERARDCTAAGRRPPRTRAVEPPAHRRSDDGADRPRRPVAERGARRRRSEEHTSELQSLMRTSYAVFCLKTTKIVREHVDSNEINTHKADSVMIN